MTTRAKLARLSGLLYFLLLPTTGFWYVTSQGVMTGDATTVLAQVVAGRARLEVAIAAGAVGFVDFLVLGIVFYWLFSPTSKAAASLLLAFIAASVPIYGIAVARQMDVLSLLNQAPLLPALGQAQLQVQVPLALYSFNNLFQVTAIYSGLWLLPLGWLVFHCGFMPRFLGVLLALGSLYYLASFSGTVFHPHYESSMLFRASGIVSGIPGFIGETGTILWLLIVGAPERQPQIRPVEAV